MIELPELCGSRFMDGKSKKLELSDVEQRAFTKALDLWCGREDCQEVELGEDQFQMTEVTSVLEEALTKQLRVDMCDDVLMWSGRGAAASDGSQLARTAGLMRMGEEELGRVVDDDRLAARNEEAGGVGDRGWMNEECG